MTLEDILHKVNRILVVESLPYDTAAADEEQVRITRELSAIYEKPMTIEVVDRADASDSALSNRDGSLVLFNSQTEDDSFPGLAGLLETRKLSARLKVLSPSAEYLIFSSLGEVGQESPVRAALKIVLRALSDSEDDGYIDRITGDRLRLFKRETVLACLDQQVSQIRHSIGGKRDTEFVKELSERYMDGNGQTASDKTFLIISDRLKGLSGKFDVVAQNSDLSAVDFKKYAAVFVDNNYSFKDGTGSYVGRGTRVLERLSSLGVNLPIIYQTAHMLEQFSDDDIRTLRALGNVLLMPKNRAFKICTPAQAKKEIAVAKILSGDPMISRYCVRVFPIGETGYLEHEGRAIIATDAAHDIPYKPLTGKSLTGMLGLRDDVYSHRLAVLAAFHSRMMPQLKNPLFADTVDYLRPWQAIEESLSAQGISRRRISQKRELYCRIKDKHDAKCPTTIVHNDPKWDNWFKDHVLGDFADCAKGSECKDIARALLDKENGFSFVCDESGVDSHVQSYRTARVRLDSQFMLPDHLELDVKELIFVESLRLARFMSRMHGKDDVVDGLLHVADQYQEVLRDSYKTMPRSGDNAPYISRRSSSL